MSNSGLFEQVVAITQEYLGPAANRFVMRILDSHFQKEPRQLKSDDIPELSEWIKVSLGLLTDDKRIVDECEHKILKLI